MHRQGADDAVAGLDEGRVEVRQVLVVGDAVLLRPIERAGVAGDEVGGGHGLWLFWFMAGAGAGSRLGRRWLLCLGATTGLGAGRAGRG